MSKKTSLVVGPGYVGWPLALKLRAEGPVYVLSRNPRSEKGIISITGDLMKDSQFTIPHIDHLYYLPAAKSSDLDVYRGVYLDGFRKILDALPEPPSTLIYVSSTSVYGFNDGEIAEEGNLGGDVDGKREILRAAEQLAWEHQGIVVRFGGIYGPGRTRFIDRIIEGDLAVTNESQYTNRIHRDDCVRILSFLQEKGQRGEAYNGVDSDSATRSELVSWVYETLGKKPRVEQHDHPKVTGKRVSNKKLLDLGFELIYPSFREGYQKYLSNLDISHK